MGIKFSMIPYASTPASQGILSGSSDILYTLPEGAIGLVKAGKMRILATAGSKRSEFFPETPTLRELGFNHVEEIKLGVYAPKGVPPEVLTKLRAAMYAAMQDPGVQANLHTAGVSPFLGTPENGLAVLQDERERWEKVLAVPEIRNSLPAAR